MKMRKILLSAVLSLVAGLSAFALSACEEETPTTGNPPTTEQTGGGNSSDENQETKITVTYDANGGAFDGGDTTLTQTVNADTVLTAPTSPKRTNYTFAGWATDKNGGSMWIFDTDKPTENVTLYAIWKQPSGKILSVENATMDGDKIFMLVNHSTEVVSLSSKVVCSDDSTWKLYYDKLGQTEIPTKIASSAYGELDDGDNIFYMVATSQDGTQVNVYELNVYRSYAVAVNFYDGTELLKTETTYTGYEYTTNYTPNITGYTFNDWNYTPRVLWDSLNLYADTTANTYTVTYDVNGGDALSATEKTVTYDSGYTLAKPTKTGYSFLGWYLGSTQITNENGSSLTPWKYDKDKTLKAKWQANEYVVTLNRNNTSAGTVTGAGDHAYDSNVTITASTNSGYTWLGWYDKDGTLVTMDYSYSFKMGFAVTYTAKWIKCPVTLERNDTNAGTVTSLTGKYKLGDDVTVTASTNSGYTFIGWYNGETLLTNELSYTFEMPAESITYTAMWSKVTLAQNDTNAGTVSSLSGTYKLGDEVTVTASTNDGYTFIGWYNGETLLTDELSYTFEMPAENLTYIAKWSKVTLVKNITNAGSISSLAGKYTLGDEVTITANTNSGYTFIGWYNGETLLTNELSYTFEMSAESVTYTAKWEIATEMRNFNFTSTATDCSITGIIDNTVTEIIVPDYVTSISYGAFKGCSALKSITIPFVGATKDGTSYTHFGYIFGADKYSYNSDYVPTSLKKVTITSGDILNGAFYECSRLTEIVIPDSVTSIGDGAFGGCSSLTEIVIPDSVTSIGDFAFSGCSSLTEIVIPDSVTSIGDSAFWDCSSLTSVVIGDRVESIGGRAFYGCSSLTGAYITDIEAWLNISFGDFEGNPLYYAKNLYLNNELVTKLEIPNAITKIKAYAFSGCSSLTEIVIPNSVTSIGYYAFESCSSLTEIVIPDSVTSIDGWAFSGCSSLTEIVIPDSVTSIGSGAFYNCSSLTGVYITDIEAWCNISFGNYYANPLYSAKNLYLNNELVKELEIPNAIKEIKQIAFCGCSSLTEIVIPNSVTSIGSSAFRDCSSLTEIVIPDGVTSIGSYAFYNCSSLTEIVIPDSVTSIDSLAFRDCSSLTIYCEAESQPSGWNDYWNSSNCPVVWGYTGEE